MKNDFKFVTIKNEIIYTDAGSKGPDDIRIWTKFPEQPWMHSLEYIGHCLRLKAMVEQRGYSISKGFAGEARLFNFCDQCIHLMSKPVISICKELKIPGY